MGKITLREAAAWCGGFVEEKYADITFFGANNDTRLIQPGELFVVLRGERDGHAYIPAAFDKGAAAVLCTKKVGDFPAIYVDDPRTALGDIARQERLRLGTKVIGVTGSVGKSTTKEMIAWVLESTFRTHKTPVNHNNDIGMPMAILAMPENTQVAVLEMGMNHFREMAYLSGIAQPDMAVIVNIGTMHIEYLGSVEGICRAKLEILEGMQPDGELLLNGDDVMLTNLPRVPAQKVTYFGTRKNSAVWAEDVCQDGGLLRFNAHLGDTSVPIALALEGDHFVIDALAAIAVAEKLGVGAEQIRQRLDTFRNLEGRQETFEARGYTIIKDCYNAGPESMEAALNVLGNRPGRRIAVLGDMLELGMCTQAEHYRVGRIAAEKADMVFAFGPNSSRVLSGCITGGMSERKCKAFTNRDELASELRRTAKPGDVLLFKGSHGMHMEMILDAFLEDEKEKEGN